MLDAGYWILDTGNWMLITDRRPVLKRFKVLMVKGRRLKAQDMPGSLFRSNWLLRGPLTAQTPAFRPGQSCALTLCGMRHKIFQD
jgi:hypothetical protein